MSELFLKIILTRVTIMQLATTHLHIQTYIYIIHTAFSVDLLALSRYSNLLF